MATYKSIRYNVDYGGNAGSLMPISLFTSNGSDATASFTSGIDSTYDSYLFIFNSIHPETDAQYFSFQGNVAGGSGYDETITSTVFALYHSEAGTSDFSYGSGDDQGQGSAFQRISGLVGNDNDQCCSGWLRLYSPSSTTFSKQFISSVQYVDRNDASVDTFAAGYFSTSSALDEIQFKFSSGEIQAGTIGMFGVQ